LGFQNVYAGATAEETVMAGGTQNVNGRADNTTISSGGSENVFGGGIASGTTIDSGGGQYVERGGLAIGTTIGAKGLEVVDSGGSDAGAQIDGGRQAVYGLAVGATVSSGSQVVENGGEADGTTVVTGGKETVLAGGFTAGPTISGGTVEIARGAVTSGSTISFAGGGMLRLDQSTGFHGLVAGFAQPDRLDLADIHFGSATKLTFVEAGSNLSGMLSVTDGIHTAKIELLGQYSAANFHLSSDGTGGTLVTDPPSALHIGHPILGHP
jgi:autotransporter passenger strand-loop-strand repeat protein